MKERIKNSAIKNIQKFGFACFSFIRAASPSRPAHILVRLAEQDHFILIIKLFEFCDEREKTRFENYVVFFPVTPFQKKAKNKNCIICIH